MKIGKYTASVFVIITLLLTACSKQPGGTVSEPVSTTAPKMEGQSANWKITVGSIRKVSKQPLEYDPLVDPVRPIEGPANKYDTLEVGILVEYIGPAAEIPSPAAKLTDDKGQTFEGVKVVFHPAPDDIFSMKNVPSDKISEVMESAEYKKRQAEIQEILGWIDPDSKEYKKRLRATKTGEKLDVSYSFKDPREYTNLKLSFEDVPPITLKPPSN